MLTIGRNGQALPTDLTLPVDRFQWVCRIVFNNGAPTVPANFIPYNLPNESILNRSRDTTLDGGTWRVTIETLADAFPIALSDLREKGLDYYDLQIDLVDDFGNQYPYHTGPIDSIEEAWVLNGGALVQTYRMASMGALQRTKRAKQAVYNYDPSTTYYDTQDMCAFSMVRIQSMGGGVVGTPIVIDGAINTWDIQIGSNPPVPGDAIQVTTDSTFATITRTYGVDYTIVNSAGGAVLNNNERAYIQWITAPPGAYYVKFWQVQYFALNEIPTVGSLRGFRCPDGRVGWSNVPIIKRNLTDDFATIVTSATTTAITVADPRPFESGQFLIAQTGFPNDYLEWRRADTGATEVRQILSTSAAGVITVSAFSAAPSAGDSVRVVTAQAVLAMHPFNARTYIYGMGYTVPLFRDAAGNVYPYGLFKPTPQTGFFTVTAARHWVTTSGTALKNYVRLQPSYGIFAVRQSTLQNRIDYVLDDLLNDFGTVYTGGNLNTYIKSFMRTDMAVSDMVAEICQKMMPPNGFLHDRPDGSFVVDGFRQATNPSAKLSNLAEFKFDDLPEPVTAVTVLNKPSEDRADVTAMLNPQIISGTVTNWNYLFDNVTSSQPGFATITDGGNIRLNVPDLLGTWRSWLNRIEIHGTTGRVLAYANLRDRVTGAVEQGAVFWCGEFRELKEGNPVIINEFEIANAYAFLRAQRYTNLTSFYVSIDLFFWTDTLWTGAPIPRITEIKAVANYTSGWTAFLTDDVSATYDTGAAPANWTTTNAKGYGNIYWQRAIGVPLSFRYIETAVAQRIQPSYNAGWLAADMRYREETITLENRTIQDCRNTAERFLDEYVRQARAVDVTAMIDPRIEPGDTITVDLPDGTNQNWFVWGISDSGGPNEMMAVYRLIDYAA